MRLKWITCRLEEGKRDDFSRLQQRWRAARYCDGLVAQVGGFDIAEPLVATIVALWRDEASHARFMDDVHDAIGPHEEQAAICSAIDVTHHDLVLRVPGQRARLHEALTAARFLRADRIAHDDGRQALVRDQLMVFNPGMAGAPGMFGGVLARPAGDGGEGTWIVTAWQTEEHHQAFAEHLEPALAERAAHDRDAAETRRVELDPNWAITGVGG